MSRPLPSRDAARAAFLLLCAGTIVGIAGIDLVLPAIPTLPATLGGGPAEAQLVIAAFVAGTALGLLGFGELGERLPARRLLIASFLAYGVSTLACLLARDIHTLIVLRFVQGASGAGAAVLAPGMIRTLYPGDRAVRAMALFGSLEALTPALAPMVGAALLPLGGWRVSFVLVGVVALALCALTLSRPALPSPPRAAAKLGYAQLLLHRRFMSLALAHACTLTALLMLVFAAPALFALSGEGTQAFVWMQLAGVSTFILSANLAGRSRWRRHPQALVIAGTLFTLAGGVAVPVVVALGWDSAGALIPLVLLFNIGLGLRGPTGFLAAIHAAEGSDARGAALVVMLLLACTSLGTAVVGLFITQGWMAPALAGLAFALVTVVTTWLGWDGIAAEPAGDAAAH